jgi:Ca-activated chloride channel family protein
MLTRFFILFFLCVSTAAAQQGPRMTLADKAATPIVLQRLAISAEISGGMAETTVRMEFFNPNRRQLEGNLQFPLADGQQITGFALDIDGVLRPAVPVDKARGREVFEAIARRQVDPGLLEVTQGNNFKLRVYPILPQGTRSVELHYSEALGRRGEAWVYKLPLAYGAVRNFELKISVNGATVAPQVSGANATLAFQRQKNGYQAASAQERFAAAGELEIVMAAAAGPRVYRQQNANDTFFVAEIPLKSVRTARPAPRTIGLLWDSSGSAAARDIDAELTELDHYFKALRKVDVRLTRLRDRPEAVQTFTVQDGNWSALRRALEQTVYDGATALNDWTPEAVVSQYLLFSDGLSNYGGALFPTLAAHQQLFALNSSQSADSARLAALAERQGGHLINIARATPGSGAQALLFQDARIEHVSASGATDIEVDSHTVRDGMLRVAGRVLSPQAVLTITIQNAGKQQLVSLPLPPDAAPHARAAALWASFRVRRLDGDFEAHRSEIGRIGRRFGIPTRETSLIVLEQLSDYVRYEIEPPVQFADQYEKLKQNANSARDDKRKNHFDTVVRMFEQRKQWWARTFSAVYKVDAQDKKMQQQQARSNFAPASPLPAPAPSMADSAHFSRQAPAPVAMAAPAMEVAGRANRAKMKSENAAPSIGMALQKWVPNAPYIERLKRASKDKVYAVYLNQKADYANSSAFFLDAADILIDKGQRDLALRVLSNLAEMDLENRAVLRILGYRLLQAGAPALALPVFEEVKRIATEEPQSFRDLGLALAAAGRPQEAIDMLYEVALRPWDDRFPDIESIALAELNAIVATSGKPLDTSRVDRRLLASLPLDLRVVLTWDADNSDMDLYVTDPSGERCDFSHNLTAQGGRMTRDFTGGYGPEEFSLRRARPGKYKIEVNYYGSRQQVIAGATTLQVKLFSGFGTGKQKEQITTLRLKEASETVFVGEFEVKP